MFDKLIEFWTKKKREMNCMFCKKKFISREYKSYHKGFGFMNVFDVYCSRKCERAMDKAIKNVLMGRN